MVASHSFCQTLPVCSGMASHRFEILTRIFRSQHTAFDKRSVAEKKPFAYIEAHDFEIVKKQHTGCDRNTARSQPRFPTQRNMRFINQKAYNSSCKLHAPFQARPYRHTEKSNPKCLPLTKCIVEACVYILSKKSSETLARFCENRCECIVRLIALARWHRPFGPTAIPEQTGRV